ncbi:efflux RND transporter periplasmic adaptor subunit [Lysobacter sp. A03]|uniref:efflux RND transporter periplasmic adaptor subunit n=1 Tax=Lysobacter sp. A03 TaxID=1199154 RepID=UPI0005B6A907|nr:efflux RND transporter periplasmic adaptor subunit [Lysobacter sp. A03]KIQ97770.1 Efflux transporter, RND family, MFP subunit, AcrA/E family [Lysobacter sp. A03]
MSRLSATHAKRARLVIAGAMLAALVACGGEPASPDRAVLPELPTFIVAADSDGASRSWDGVVEAVQQAELTAQTAGRVTAVNVDINDRVAAGDVLLRLTAVEQQAGANTARAQLRAAEAAAAEASANYRRHAALAEGQFVSRAQLDQVRAARDSAAAARDAARAQLAQAGQQTEYTVVRAPFAGVVDARRVEPGESVAPGQPLLAIHAPGALRIQVQVPQSDAAAIRAAGRAQVQLADGRAVDAEVAVYPAADPLTHSVGVRVMLPELDDAPTPGVTAKVVFPIAGVADAAPIRIPRSAIAQRGELSSVYVLSGDRLALRQLRLGRRSGDSVEVLAGLRVGDEVVSDPTRAVQAVAAQRRATGGSND